MGRSDDGEGERLLERVCSRSSSCFVGRAGVGKTAAFMCVGRPGGPAEARYLAVAAAAHFRRRRCSCHPSADVVPEALFCAHCGTDINLKKEEYIKGRLFSGRRPAKGLPVCESRCPAAHPPATDAHALCTSPLTPCPHACLPLQ